MKTLKRMSALALSLIMVLSCAVTSVVFADSAMSDVEQSHTHYKAIADLVEKGIITGYEDGTFRPEGNITRAEFCAIVARADAPAGYVFSSASSQFEDVAAEASWAVGYVDYACRRGIVNGFEDGTFRPNESVTYGQAVKMIVCALNYGAMVTPTTPWYQGYINLAMERNITKNAFGAPEAPAARSLVAQLTYNMGNAAPAVQSGVDENGKPVFEFSDEKQNEEKYVEGVLMAAYKESITGQSDGLNKYQALVVDNDTYHVFNIGSYTVEELSKLLGYGVRVTYSENNSGNNVIDRISKTSANNVIELNDIDVFYIDNNKLEYATEDDEEKINFDNNMKVIINGEVVSDNTPFTESFAFEAPLDSGKITLIDNDNDGAAEVAFIKKYETMYVGNVVNSNGKYTMYDKFNNNITEVFDEAEDNITVKVLSNGSNNLADAELSAITSSSIVSWATGEDFVEIIVSKQTASGSNAASNISTINSKNVVTIDKKDYYMSNYYLSHLNSPSENYPQELRAGDSCIVYLDYAGKIAAIDKKQATVSYGYITLVGTMTENGMESGDYAVCLYDVSGKRHNGLVIDDKGFKIDGHNADPSELMDIMINSAAVVNADKDESDIVNADQAALVKYEISGGKLKSVETIGTSITPTYLANATDGDLKYNSGTNEFKLGSSKKFSISSTTKVIVVPTNRNDNKYRVLEGTSYFANSLSYTIDAYDASGNGPAKAVVVYGISQTIRPTADTILVKDVTNKLGEDGKEVSELTYVVLGQTSEKKVTATDDRILSNVDKGDIIQMLVMNNKLEKIHHIFDADAAEGSKIIDVDGADDDAFKITNGQLRYVLGTSVAYEVMYGTVTLRPGDSDGAGGDNMNVSFEINEETGEGVKDIAFVVRKSIPIVKYTGDENGDTQVFEFGKAREEIIDTAVDKENASKVVVIRCDGVVKGVVIY